MRDVVLGFLLIAVTLVAGLLLPEDPGQLGDQGGDIEP